jgi:MFS family permease
MLKALCKAILLGPTLAPLLGGTVTYYFSWRTMQGSIGVMGLLVWVVILLFFPETTQPETRGVDMLRLKEGVNWRERFVFVNPLRPLALLRSPNLFLIVRSVQLWNACHSV